MRGKELTMRVAAALLFTTVSAQATMGAKTMMERLDADHDGTVSRAEVRAAAGRKYDLIASKNGGHVTSVALSGRLTKDALQDIQTTDAKKGGNVEPDSVSRDLYLAQAEKAFDEAHIMKTSDAKPNDDALTLGELSAPSAKNLIDLLQ